MSPSASRRSAGVVVTGIGLRTALGADTESSWNALRAGRSAACWLGLATGDNKSGLAVPVEHKTAFAGYPIRGTQRQPWELIEHAAREAFRDAGIDPDRLAPDVKPRIATVVALSKGDLVEVARAHRRLWEHGPERMGTPWPWCGPSGPAMGLTERWDLRGPSLAPVAACATGVVAALLASELIRRGECDLALAGSIDASLDPFLLGAFQKMRALAKVVDDPKAAVRPWDKGRSGFLVGEGGAILVLERAEHARARGGLPYAELVGGALGSDAYHETNLNPDPSNLAYVIQTALERAGTSTNEIDAINVHGTATRGNDPLECMAIRRVFGRYAERVSCSANKAQIGHLLGGAGAAELAITCLTIRDQFVPPTLNLHDPDPICDLDGTPLVGRFRSIGGALKLSLGFGGHLAAVVFKRPEGACRNPVGVS